MPVVSNGTRTCFAPKPELESARGRPGLRFQEKPSSERFGKYWLLLIKTWIDLFDSFLHTIFLDLELCEITPHCRSRLPVGFFHKSSHIFACVLYLQDPALLPEELEELADTLG